MKKCKGCNTPIEIKGNKKFCTINCRERYYDRTLACRTKEYRDNYNHAKWNKYEKGKIKCLICGGWYRAVLHHAWQRHGTNEAEYKKAFGLDHKKSLITDELKAIHREHTLSNGTMDNLKKGKSTRFVKGDPRAGRYERSAQTLARLKKLSTLRSIQRDI